MGDQWLEIVEFFFFFSFSLVMIYRFTFPYNLVVKLVTATKALC